jgi:chemotaxis protein MotB
MSRKAPEAKAPENHERWIVSYADMVTLLWALFVVLYALSDSNPRKLLIVQQSIDRAFNVGVLSGSSGASPIFDAGGGLTPSIGQIKANDLTSIQKKLNEFSKSRGLENKIQIREDADSITISLADNLLFASGDANLRPGAQDVLQQVAEVLNQLPNQLQIEGHTDNVPVNNSQFPTNWELSAARASTVVRFLSEGAGVPANRLHLEGYADTRPVADNGTPEGRALNRRADIVILYPTAEDLQRSLSGSKGN